jgi:hypothetical protein
MDDAQYQAQAETEAQAQAQAQAEAQAQAQAQAARVEVEAYMTPELLDREIDHRHHSFVSAVLGEDVRHVHPFTMRMLLRIHDLWVPKYVN